ncbi:hypothetical protein I4U23_029440 [Adineta vaga]|nr:hypothetical protein I4U23_029440 [Adineta vaga]
MFPFVIPFSYQRGRSMTASLMFERVSNHSCSFPFEKTSTIDGKSYYKFCQLELRQLLKENRFHQKQDGNFSKGKSQTIDNKHLIMDRQREKTKLQARNSDTEKRTTLISSVSLPNNSNTIESQSKSRMKTKYSLSSTKHHSVINSFSTKQKNHSIKPLLKLPTIEIVDDNDENLSFSNAYSYTQVLSSSHDHNHENDQYAQQLILKAIMSHLNSCATPDISKWNVYRDFHNKFSMSTSPNIYRNFERIIL